MGIREASPRSDPILIGKMILALILVEQLRRSGLELNFKGGTSLVLLLGMPRRFSIDIDIVLPGGQPLEDHFLGFISQGVFIRFEESKCAGELPKQHYRFYFTSAVQNKESHIQLDILFERNPYLHLQEVELISPLISVEGDPTKIICPTLEGLLGDKLTAFAPHTTGIRFGADKELEVAKQLFDVAILFDEASDMEMVDAAFRSIAFQELAYRGLSELTPEDVLMDALTTAILLGMRGPSPTLRPSNSSRGLGSWPYSFTQATSPSTQESYALPQQHIFQLS
jgi:predicted nucleotidyltransferase component of viral defense system